MNDSRKNNKFNRQYLLDDKTVKYQQGHSMAAYQCQNPQEENKNNAHENRGAMCATQNSVDTHCFGVCFYSTLQAENLSFRAI
uniref:Uncharacterized protein n=1 Tax=Anguilla anguilla TaxID=7936 RepID=A0A0E9UVX2_ANGAN